MNKKQTILLTIIDMQNDFCDTPPEYISDNYTPSLPLPGAHCDALRVSNLIRYADYKITDIQIFMDTHHRLDIGHFDFWKKADNSSIIEITAISKNDVVSGKYVPINTAVIPHVLKYFEQLYSVDIHEIYVYPAHCELGSIGHALHPDIHKSLVQWQIRNHTVAEFIMKGENPLTENYSGLRSVYQDINIPSTLLNKDAVYEYINHDITVFVGEASTHCVWAHIKDAWEAVYEIDNSFDFSRFVILTDCMSPVPGYRNEVSEFLAFAAAAGMRVMTHIDFLLSEY